MAHEQDMAALRVGAARSQVGCEGPDHDQAAGRFVYECERQENHADAGDTAPVAARITCPHGLWITLWTKWR